MRCACLCLCGRVCLRWGRVWPFHKGAAPSQLCNLAGSHTSHPNLKGSQSIFTCILWVRCHGDPLRLRIISSGSQVR